MLLVLRRPSMRCPNHLALLFVYISRIWCWVAWLQIAWLQIAWLVRRYRGRMVRNTAELAYISQEMHISEDLKNGLPESAG
jgi:hypothetical protein